MWSIIQFQLSRQSPDSPYVLLRRATPSLRSFAGWIPLMLFQPHYSKQHTQGQTLDPDKVGSRVLDTIPTYTQVTSRITNSHSWHAGVSRAHHCCPYSETSWPYVHPFRLKFWQVVVQAGVMVCECVQPVLLLSGKQSHVFPSNHRVWGYKSTSKLHEWFHRDSKSNYPRSMGPSLTHPDLPEQVALQIRLGSHGRSSNETSSNATDTRSLRDPKYSCSQLDSTRLASSQHFANLIKKSVLFPTDQSELWAFVFLLAGMAGVVLWWVWIHSKLVLGHEWILYWLGPYEHKMRGKWGVRFGWSWRCDVVGGVMRTSKTTPQEKWRCRAIPVAQTMQKAIDQNYTCIRLA
jgi:hypothetical protein